MKKISILIVLAFISFITIAQNNKRKTNINKDICVNPQAAKSKKSTVYTYTYDFSNMKKNEDCNVIPRHKKDLVYININNINLLLYDIEAAGIAQNLPQEYKNLFDTLVNLKANSINTTTNSVESAPPPNSQKTDNKGVLLFKINKSTKAKQSVIIPTPYYAEKKKIEDNQTYINTHFSAWISDMQKLENFLKYGKNVNSLIEAECCSQNKLKESLITEVNVLKFDTSIYSVGSVNIVMDYPKLISSVNTTPSALVSNIKKELEQMKKAKQDADDLIASIRKDCKKNKTQDKPECDVDNLEDNYPPDLSKAFKMAEKIDASKIDEAAGELNKILNKVNSEKNFKYDMLTPFEIEGDAYKAKVKLKPKTQYAASIKSDSITIPLLVKGKFEWAIGPGINFHLSKSLRNESFQIDSARNSMGNAQKDTFNIIQNQNRSKMIPSIGVMAHFYWQQQSSITPGIVLGLSTSVADLKDLRAYLGLSLMAGGLSDKIYFNTGFAFGWSDRLKPNLQIGENTKSQIPFTGDKVGSPEQLVEKAFHAGWFFGLTYKLSK
jgi:hypothetical protein